MRLYCTTAKDNPPHWTGSQSDAGSHRAALNKQGVPRKEIDTTEYDIPTGKADLIAWLNSHAVSP